MPKFEPVAWLRDTLDGGLSTMTDCCTNVVKEIWLKANPKNVERYTAPLYTLDQLTKAYEAGKRDAIPEADRLSDENDQLRAQINMLREALEYCVTQVGELATVPGIASALSPTPEQSLDEYRNKVIEACAKLCDERSAYFNSASAEHFEAADCAAGLRAMKEQP